MHLLYTPLNKQRNTNVQEINDFKILLNVKVYISIVLLLLRHKTTKRAHTTKLGTKKLRS